MLPESLETQECRPHESESHGRHLLVSLDLPDWRATLATYYFRWVSESISSNLLEINSSITAIVGESFTSDFDF